MAVVSAGAPAAPPSRHRGAGEAASQRHAGGGQPPSASGHISSRRSASRWSRQGEESSDGGGLHTNEPENAELNSEVVTASATFCTPCLQCVRPSWLVVRSPLAKASLLLSPPSPSSEAGLGPWSICLSICAAPVAASSAAVQGQERQPARAARATISFLRIRLASSTIFKNFQGVNGRTTFRNFPAG